MAFESKQGISDLEKFCLELDEEERRKREKAQKKRDKKSKQKLNRSNRIQNNKDMDPIDNDRMEDNAKESPKCKKAAVSSQGSKNCSKNNCPKAISQVSRDPPPQSANNKVAPTVNEVDALPTTAITPASLTEKRKVKPVITARRMHIQDVPSLESMLKDEDNEENFIPLEDIRAFQARFPVVNRQREELRKNLRQRFNQLCVNGL